MSVQLLSPQKVLLLAVHLASSSDIASLSFLAAQHHAVLRKDVILRILLTYLPETVPSSTYVGLLRHLAVGSLATVESVGIDTGPVDGLSDRDATRKAKRLYLLPLATDGLPLGADAENPLEVFLFQRACRLDEEAGLLVELPDLLRSFAQDSVAIRAWAGSVVLPLLRRNYEYHTQQSPSGHTLREFENLPERAAVEVLLSQTAAAEPGESDADVIGRDLRGLIGPWIHSDARWRRRRDSDDGRGSSWTCPGWEIALEWLTAQALQNRPAVQRALERWNALEDIDLGPFGPTWLDEDKRDYLRRRHARAGLAAAFLIPASSLDELACVYALATRVTAGAPPESATLQDAAAALLPVEAIATDLLSRASPGNLRNRLLDESNVLTCPDGPAAAALLRALAVSTLIISAAGCQYTVRRTCELLLLADEREQKSEFRSLIRAVARRAPPQGDDGYWTWARQEVIWLHDWGRELGQHGAGADVGTGVFGRVRREFIEAEILHALLANTRLSLARAIYETGPARPLPAKALEDGVVAAAMNAYDNASNPNRTRGGLKKCDEIIRAFPDTVPPSCEAARRIEALLKATHTLSDYRLVLRQGEPFTPVFLRVHSDPVSIIGKVLEQNGGSYTRTQECIDLGANMLRAGLLAGDKTKGTDQERLILIERRVVAMCVEAGLAEDDFETAYSYVVNRLGAAESDPADDWSWSAAFRAGQYVRTGRTGQPTHLGTASGNLEIRHLEQRIECLATALLLAPAPRLHEVVTAFRQCEEELDGALRAEAASEDAWDEAADTMLMMKTSPMPGMFVDVHAPAPAPQRTRPVATGDEAPMSLFDLSRATARIASQNLNFSALSGLQRSASSAGAGARVGAAEDGGGGGRPQSSGGGAEGGQQNQNRTRRRDQLRVAAVGTLVSGVGWLVGAQPSADRGNGGG